jgi:hypothetical protein
MHVQHKCKHCGKTERHHGAFRSECLVNGRKVSDTQTFQADPEKFTVFALAPRPRTTTELMRNIGR